MGELAKTLVALSGPDSVHGIIPEALIKHEQANATDATKAMNEKTFGRTTVVKDMHSRKHMMAKEVISGGPGSGFVALSGGFGTLEELMEVTTWNQLGIHDRGVVVFSVDGYYNGLMAWIHGAVGAGFISEVNRGILVEAKTAEETVRCLKEYEVSKERYKLDWNSEG